MPDDPAPSPGPVARPFVEVRALLRAFGIASDPRKLILAAVGLLALLLGWSALGRACGRPADPWARVGPGSRLDAPMPEVGEALVEAGWRLTEPARVVVGPSSALFGGGIDPVGWLHAAGMALWAVAVWGIFGGAIARIAVVQAAGGPRPGVGSAFRFAVGKSGSLIGAPLTPMLAVAIFAGVLAAFGLLHRIPWGIGPTVAGFLGFVPLLVGVVLALILLGLAAGWPLMHLTVAAENEDAADALSRSYSYVNQRLARYAANAGAAWGIGTLGLLAVAAFARSVLHLAGWGVALGAPHPIPVGPPLAQTALAFWGNLVGWLVHGWIYSYFWSAAAVIYLILRRDVDGKEWHDVYLPEHDADTFAGDPPADPGPTKAVEPEVG
jgi:hypothetical protein